MHFNLSVREQRSPQWGGFNRSNFEVLIRFCVNCCDICVFFLHVFFFAHSSQISPVFVY